MYLFQIFITKKVNKKVKREIQTFPLNSAAQQHFHKSLPPTLFLCCETFSLALHFVNIWCLKQEHASRVVANVTESLGKSYSNATVSLNIIKSTQYPFPVRDLTYHVTHAVYLHAKYILNYSTIFFRNTKEILYLVWNLILKHFKNNI